MITVAESAFMPSGPVSEIEARRFLWQAAWGPGPDDVAFVIANGYEAWIDAQIPKTPNYVTRDLADQARSLNRPHLPENLWEGIAIAGEDQLRQRIAWALSQIFAIRNLGAADHETYSTFILHALPDPSMNSAGNYRGTLFDMTYHDLMGEWLTYIGNRKADPVAGTEPDQNYGREVMQLFTIGLWELNQDGTFVRDVFGDRVPTYDQVDIAQISNIFTGLFSAGRDEPVMEMRPEFHEFAEVQLLDYPGAVTPGGLIPAGTPSVFEADQRINDALDNLFHHPTFIPFIGEQLIKRTTTSNPTPAYIARVSEAFAGAGPYGSGVRGDMAAVFKAILLDDEARNPAYRSNPMAGKVLEPLVIKLGTHRALGNVDRRDLAAPFQKSFGNRRSPFSQFGQAFGFTPSVFNFYKPEFAPLNTDISRAGLVAPELEIVNDNTVLTAVRSYDDVGRTDAMLPSIASELVSLAGDPAALVDRVDEIIAFGATHPDIKAIITQAVADNTSNNAGTQADRRIRAPVGLIIANPRFRHFR